MAFSSYVVEKSQTSLSKLIVHAIMRRSKTLGFHSAMILSYVVEKPQLLSVS